MAGNSGTFKRVLNSDELDIHKHYALAINDGSDIRELGRFVGKSEKGAAFVIMKSLVRQDMAVHNVTIEDRVIPNVVFEIKGEA